ncbi:MAG: aldehyde dehydrogenase family protein, partial [Rubrivivax sp.]|nr:aldehyde dehydrogenase family protein [Rubrivivax sp.]
MLKLKDPGLFKQQAYIAGEWVDADDGKTIAVTNPANGEQLGTVPLCGAAETARAIAAADVAQRAWRDVSAKERGATLRRLNDLMLANADDLALIMTSEQGKPLAEAKGEIAYAAGYLEWFAEEGKRAYGEIVPPNVADRRILVTREPVGVCAAITPWNFPSAMITRKAGAALAAGCTMVVKPASQTPFSALALAELAGRAGLPRGVFNVVTGSAKAIGGEICANPIVRKLS